MGRYDDDYEKATGYKPKNVMPDGKYEIRIISVGADNRKGWDVFSIVGVVDMPGSAHNELLVEDVKFVDPEDKDSRKRGMDWLKTFNLVVGLKFGPTLWQSGEASDAYCGFLMRATKESGAGNSGKPWVNWTWETVVAKPGESTSAKPNNEPPDPEPPSDLPKRNSESDKFSEDVDLDSDEPFSDEPGSLDEDI